MCQLCLRSILRFGSQCNKEPRIFMVITCLQNVFHPRFFHSKSTDDEASFWSVFSCFAHRGEAMTMISWSSESESTFRIFSQLWKRRTLCSAASGTLYYLVGMLEVTNSAWKKKLRSTTGKHFHLEPPLITKVARNQNPMAHCIYMKMHLENKNVCNGFIW